MGDFDSLPLAKAPPSLPPKDSKKSQEFLDAGRAAIKKGDSTLAAKKLKAAILYNAENAEAFSLMGDLIKQEAEEAKFNAFPDARRDAYSHALASYQMAIKLNPKLPDPYFRCGQIYFSLSMLEKAKNFFQKGLAVSPSFAGGSDGLAKVNAAIAAKRPAVAPR